MHFAAQLTSGGVFTLREGRKNGTDEGRMGDALALGGEEGRDKLR